MKHLVRFVVSVIAAGGLLASAASNATDLAELPLKASVLAKPNVIWGLDDSSSMDSEVMLATNDGAFWWDYNARSGWNASGTPWFNDAGAANTQWRKMVYLFPNGNGDGTPNGARINVDASNDHFAIMPTKQFAWLRSADYNPLYYNPTVTYKPWSPAYTTPSTFSAATATSAKSHPIFGTRTINLTADVALSTTSHYTFMALPGMVIPKDAQYCTNNNGGCSGGWTTVTATGGYTVPAGSVLRVAMAYTPATYYKKETCTYDGTTCVYAPDGSTTLKRYQPAVGSADMQNFANWWQYYRKRKLMLAAAMGQVLESLTGLRMGVVLFNSRSAPTIYDLDNTSDSLNGRAVAAIFYNNNTTGGTPTRETLKYIGDYYAGSSTPIQYACQRNNAFIVTDGFANATTGSSVTPPTYATTYVTGAPYETIHKPSLADIASSYYTNNLKSSLATGKVPTNSTDSNTNLHMNTYGLTLGAKGTIYLSSTTPPPTNTATWPNPSSDRSPTAVDDLWHATINGRGQMYLATTPQETALRIRAGIDDILSARGAQGGVAVSTVNLSRGDGFAYMGVYNPSGWSGDLTANVIDPVTGAIAATPTWSASTILSARAWGNRVIASANAAGVGKGFTETDVGDLVNSPVAVGATPPYPYGNTAQVMNYLRGDTSLESTVFRRRTSLIGGVLNAEPVISREDNIVYVASGEGMLHAFDIAAGADRGKELWAFVPRAVLPDIGKTTSRSYTFKTQLDGTPVVGKYSATNKMLVAGMGAAGNGYYAIDVTSPRAYTEAQLANAYKWEFPTASDTATQAKVGQTVGKPNIVKLTDGTYAVLVTSGYNSTADGLGRLWMLNPSTGAIVHEFVTSEGTTTSEAGLAHISPYAEDDGTVQYAYGGDLLGNVWRFDLIGKGAPTKLAVLKSSTGARQPVTAAPELAYQYGQRVVIVGTGRLLGISDLGNAATQTLYAIGGDVTATMDPARNSLVQQTYDAATNTITNAAANWSTQHGWYVDLPAGQQANTHPVLVYGGVAFVTNKTGANDCSASSYLYVVDVTNGGVSSNVTEVSQVLWADANATGLTAVLTESGDVRGEIRSYDGELKSPQIAKKPTIDAKKNSWREVRKE